MRGDFLGLLVATAGAVTACRGIAGVEDIPVLVVGPDATTEGGVDAGFDSAAAQETSVAEDAPNEPADAGTPLPEAAASACPDGGEVMCGEAGTCLPTDPLNCGACGNDCTSAPHVNGAATTCIQGTCAYSCSTGYTNCGDAGPGCPTSLVTPQTCGSCTTVCPAQDPLCSGPSTSGGTATCTSSCSGTTPDLCGSVCVDNQTDQDHCGTSCAACTNQTCVAGACSGSCAPGQISCMGSVPQTCGPTGLWVAGTVTSGKCGAVCTPGATQCMGGNQQTCSTDGAWVTAAVVVGTCGAVCLPGAAQCVTGAAQSCAATGQWNAATPCTGATAPFCYQGVCSTEPPSCQGSGAGAGLNCGGTSGTTDCCATLAVPGNTLSTFDRDDNPSYPATIASFRLDEFEVTVGRFRKFVTALVGGWTPPNGSGIHTHLNSGSGLVDSGGTGNEKGWDAADWNVGLSSLASNPDTEFSSWGSGSTWTHAAGANEHLPITNVTWYQAYAFCIWDGGFLPSEAEWNYAAEGGAQYQNYYPWGALASVHGSITNYAITACGYPSGTTGTTCSGTVADIAPVGFIAANGTAIWGQFDLAGNAIEWNLDWYVSPYATSTCTNCADMTTPLVPHPGRVLRGGSYDMPTSEIINSARNNSDPQMLGTDGIGLRCARTP